MTDSQDPNLAREFVSHQEDGRKGLRARAALLNAERDVIAKAKAWRVQDDGFTDNNVLLAAFEDLRSAVDALAALEAKP